MACPCANVTAVLASLSDWRCRLPSDEGGGRTLVLDDALPGLSSMFDAASVPKDGIRLTLGGACVPLSYGSSQCLQHDLLHDYSVCRVAEAGDRVVPAYCFRPWCYVDRDACKRESEERVYRSAYFSHDSGVDLFYSYSTCNSTNEDWLAVEDDIVGNSRAAFGEISIEANVPSYVNPMIFKRGANGESLSSVGSEYYDDSVPFEGVYIKYMKKIMEISKGDLKDIKFTHRSRASSLVHPTSSFTASVQDIEDGLVDMSVGPFWITAQRLNMAAFSLPVSYDKTFLVIPRPGTTDTLNDQIKKVLAPFSYELWGLVLVVIAVAAALGVWFTDKSVVRRTEWRMSLRQGMHKKRRRKIAYARLTLDSFLQKGLYFCSAGVEQDEGASLPYQLLMFGFGFFILIAVSAYVANLAAFLTLSSVDSVKSMEGAVAAGFTICAHPALMGALQVAWPSATFYFHEDGNEFQGMLDDFDRGKCRVLAVGYEDTGMDRRFLERLSERDLVYTDSLIIEMPIGFPIRPELAAGLSYWMIQGEKYHGASIEVAREDFKPEVSCDVQFSEGDVEASEYDEITVKNMFFPLVFFACSALVAILLQIRHHCNVKHGRQSLVGRKSSMDLVEEVNESERRNRKTIMSRIGRSPFDEDDFKDDPDEKDAPLRRSKNPSVSFGVARSAPSWAGAAVAVEDPEDAGEDHDGLQCAGEEGPGPNRTNRSIMTGVMPLDDDFVENGVKRAGSTVRFKDV